MKKKSERNDNAAESAAIVTAKVADVMTATKIRKPIVATKWTQSE